MTGNGKIINLRAARKSAARDAARKQGDENAAKFGRTKAQREVEDADRSRVSHILDRHKREDGDD
ncbi:DUF4169 family protein [Paracoccus aestuariivivens]|uniref:DUF4169 family protein n=1 Tax=Paracoccus aestuariivivens TaxID=1820333 RepID=UPI0012BABEB2|nr:DUF4169 family protein [Paracoccus aestuariivivens]